MATHRINITGFNTMTDATGDVYFEPYNIKATNDVWRHGHFIFNDTSTRILLYGLFEVPKNYVGTAKVVIVWTSTVTAGNVVWDFDYRAVGGNDTESLDQAGTQEAVTVTDAAPGAANRRMEVSISLTSTNFAVDDSVEFLLARDGADVADTMAGPAQLVSLMFEYSDA